MGSRICSTYSVRHSASPNHSRGRVSIAYILRPISASCIVSLAWFSPSCRTISSISSSSPPVAPKEPHRVSAGPDDPALVPCARPRRLILAMCRSMQERRSMLERRDQRAALAERVWGGRQPPFLAVDGSDPRQESCSLCFCRCTPHHARWLLTYLRRWSAAKEGTLHASRDAPNCSRDGHQQRHQTDNGARSRVARSSRRTLVGFERATARRKRTSSLREGVPRPAAAAPARVPDAP